MNTVLMTIIMMFSVDFNVNVQDVKYKFILPEEVPSLRLDPLKNGKKSFQAFCRYKTKTIYIDKAHWDSLPFVHKRELIYHELGHCHFYLRHAPEGIMKMGVYSTKLDGSNWKQLVRDMKRLVRPVKSE